MDHRDRYRRIVPAGLAIALAVATSAFAGETRLQRAGSDIPDTLVTATLVCDAATIAPGTPFDLAVKLSIRDEWHVNWQNPGDAGLAPSIAWQLPAGFTVEPVQWPLPHRFRSGPLVIFGYEHAVLFVARVTPPATLQTGAPVRLGAGVSWLACSEACIPGKADVTITVPVEAAARRDASAGAEIAATLSQCPAPSGMWNVASRLDSNGFIAMDIQAATDAHPALDGVFFFPYEPGYIDNAAPQALSVLTSPGGRAAYQLRVDVSRTATARPVRLSGVLVSAGGWSSSGGGPGAIAIDVPLTR